MNRLIPTPQVFGVPPGADFPSALAELVLRECKGLPPENLARVQILVNTKRMERRLTRLFTQGGAVLLPKIGQVTNISALYPAMDLPKPISKLRRKLELSELTRAFLEAEPTFASRASAVDLAEALASLVDEMQGEGVPTSRIRELNLDNVSAHWDRSKRFLDVISTYLSQTGDEALDVEARQRLAVEAICDHWESNPPETPVFIAGSTGSRSTTRLLIKAVATLPQGRVVLPGFDFDVPDEVWSSLSQSRDAEDHPQYRLASLLADLGVAKSNVQPLAKPPDEMRNRLISLSLRPAKVTDQWMSEGPQFDDLSVATKGLTLIEAPDTRSEAMAIAIALREAVQNGQRSALITTDRTLSRRVAAVLSRWSIRPDDSAGVPLSLTPAGRFLREIGRMIGKPISSGSLISLLKHTLTRSQDGLRGPHLLATRKLELALRKKGISEFADDTLEGLRRQPDNEHKDWWDWLSHLTFWLQVSPEPSLGALLDHHVSVAETLVGQPDLLWGGKSGEACFSLVQKFQEEADFSGDLPLRDYLRLFESGLSAESYRDPDIVHPDVMIWGTLEARVQGAERVVLGGLNDGVWPEPSNPDPLLNRKMRRDLGLLLPESQVGLAAHDYQQAIAGQDVFLTRAVRTQEGEAIPSRWLNRLTNLLQGLPKQSGVIALDSMRDRGKWYLEMASILDRPEGRILPARRPAPAPPVAKRPDTLAVTEIQKLIRDPYAIYGKHILRLSPLLPLDPKPDARLKGIVFHKIAELFFDPKVSFENEEHAKQVLISIAKEQIAAHVPRQSIRLHWESHVEAIAAHLIRTEQERRGEGARIGKEVQGSYLVSDTGVTISGTADRIDRLHSGSLVIYDFKTGSLPSKKQVEAFDRQLLVEAVMAEAGVFKDIDAAPVERVVHLGLGRSPKESTIPIQGDYETVTIQDELAKLLSNYQDPNVAYVSRRAMEKLRFEGDYDHLARHGEWDASQATMPEPME